MSDLRLLLPVAAALPRVHRPAIAGFQCGGARLAQPPEAIHEQPPRDLRQAKVEERVHVELVPEDVPAVGLPVQAAGGDARVLVGREPRADLQEVRDVQAKQELHPLVAGNADVAHLPEVLPRAHVVL